MEEMAVWREVYESIGYESVVTSAVEAIGLEEVKALLDHKVTLLSGHSGVGKSTLINAIEPGLDLKTAEVSDSHNKGKHTTTYAEVFPLSNEGFIIDTPGIKGFGLIDIPKEELHHYFPEMFALLPECKFHNCLHLTEPGCAVVKAVESGRVPETRYHRYRTMYEQDGDETYRGAF